MDGDHPCWVGNDLGRGEDDEIDLRLRQHAGEDRAPRGRRVHLLEQLAAQRAERDQAERERGADRRRDRDADDIAGDPVGEVGGECLRALGEIRRRLADRGRLVACHYAATAFSASSAKLIE